LYPEVTSNLFRFPKKHTWTDFKIEGGGAMKAFVGKLIDTTRYHSDQISREWARAVRSNPRTPSYHSLSEDVCVRHAVSFYKNLRQMLFSEKPYIEVRDYFTLYAEERHKEGIPLHEAVYALIMMRRQLWLFADFQGPFLSGLDKEQAVGAINTTIRIFDHGIYLIIKTYGQLSG